MSDLNTRSKDLEPVVRVRESVWIPGYSVTLILAEESVTVEGVENPLDDLRALARMISEITGDKIVSGENSGVKVPQKFPWDAFPTEKELWIVRIHSLYDGYNGGDTEVVAAGKTRAEATAWVKTMSSAFLEGDDIEEIQEADRTMFVRSSQKWIFSVPGKNSFPRHLTVSQSKRL